MTTISDHPAVDVPIIREGLAKAPRKVTIAAKTSRCAQLTVALPRTRSQCKLLTHRQRAVRGRKLSPGWRATSCGCRHGWEWVLAPRGEPHGVFATDGFLCVSDRLGPTCDGHALQ